MKTNIPARLGEQYPRKIVANDVSLFALRSVLPAVKFLERHIPMDGVLRQSRPPRECPGAVIWVGDEDQQRR